MFMRTILVVTAILFSPPAIAEGNVENGEKLFRNCKACHLVAIGKKKIVRGGKAGPNLYGVIGRPAADLPKYRYSPGLIEAREAGLVWTEENFTGFVTNPNVFLPEQTGQDIASKMPFALPEGGADIAAYLKSLVEE